MCDPRTFGLTTFESQAPRYYICCRNLLVTRLVLLCHKANLRVAGARMRCRAGA